MNIEFHYHITYLIAIAAGHSRKNAYKIAFSSQFVDDNNKDINIKFRNKNYHNILTQTYDPTHHHAEQIWQSFHFIPGLVKKSNRADKRIDFRITAPNNTIACKAISFALKENNLYLLGIAAHALADTYAHQNFIGGFSTLNILDNSPNYLFNHFGHADALDWPDIINLTWQDNRLNQPFISNKHRALKAAAKIYLQLKKFHKPKTSCKNLIAALSDAIGDEVAVENYSDGEASKIKRLDNYQQLALDISGDLIPNYNANNWLADACYKRFGSYYGRDSFLQSNYYQFCKAAKKHYKFVQHMLLAIHKNARFR